MSSWTPQHNSTDAEREQCKFQGEQLMWSDRMFQGTVLQALQANVEYDIFHPRITTINYPVLRQVTIVTEREQKTARTGMTVTARGLRTE
jgi:hypothetical protein